MPRKAVDEIVLAAVRLIGDDDNVPALRQYRVTVASLLGQEFLDRREHDAAPRDPQFVAQIGAALGLYRVLAQQIAAAGKGVEQLVVEIVPVGDNMIVGFSIAGCRISCPA